MSRIIEKPFNWGQKIIRAVFKGKPNLITAPDLNRQLEILRMQNRINSLSLGMSLAETANLNFDVSTKTLTYKLKNVFFGGIRYFEELEEGRCQISDSDFNRVTSFQFWIVAKKRLVTSNDDGTKKISGAKFEDNTTQPAADHYIYEDFKVTYVIQSNGRNRYYDKATLEETLVNRNEEYLFVAPLCRVVNHNIERGYIDVVPYIIDSSHFANGPLSEKYPLDFGTLHFLHLGSPSSNTNALKTSDIVTPKADIVANLYAVFSRLYEMEQRIFSDTLYATNVNSFVKNGVTYQRKRYCQYNIGGNTKIQFGWYVIGNMCFVSGRIDVASSQSIDKEVTLGVETDEADLKCSMPKVISDTNNFQSWRAIANVLEFNTSGDDSPIFPSAISTTKATGIKVVDDEDYQIGRIKDRLSEEVSSVVTNVSGGGSFGVVVFAIGDKLKVKSSGTNPSNSTRYFNFDMQYPISSAEYWQYVVQDDADNYNK